jgi:hypothetical protein
MQDKPEGSQEQGQANPTSPPPRAFISPTNPPPVPPINGQGAATQSHNEQPDKLTKNDKVMIALTVAIALGTIVSAVAIVLQWREMVGGGKQTDKIIEAANINASAANRSADASQQFADTAVLINGGIGDAVKKLEAQAGISAAAIKATQDAMRLDQRAWVAVKDAHGPPLEPVVVFINTGRTPGRNVVAYPSIMYALKGVIPDFDVDAAPKRLGLLSPGTEREIDSNTAVPDLEQRDLYIFGKITYDDVFRKPHWVTYCLRLSDDRKLYQFCEKHNDTDGIGRTQNK